MKKFYALVLASFLFSLGVNAQFIQDNFETYTLGDMGLQNTAVWSTWDGFPDNGTNILVVDDIVSGGVQSGYIGPEIQGQQRQDCLFLVGNVDSGNYIVFFDMFISSGSTAYFGIEGETEENLSTGYQGATGCNNPLPFIAGIPIARLTFNKDGLEPGVFRDIVTGETAMYPEDTWFSVSSFIDLDALTYEIAIDGTLVHASPAPFENGDTLGGINFVPVDENNNFWIDDILFDEDLFAGIDDFSSANFKVYPNPVQDLLNIRTSTPIDTIAVYDVLGKLVLATTPDSISSTIDMSSLNSGVYLLKVTIGGVSKTVKVIK